jgi:hypothetical protein
MVERQTIDMHHVRSEMSMIEHIAWWNLGTDLCLFASLVWLGFKVITISTGTARGEMQELADGLKELLREADKAASNLNEQLSKRERSLERLLYDLESAEHRVGRALTTFEDTIKKSESASVEAQRQAVAAVAQPIVAQPSEQPKQRAVQAYQSKQREPVIETIDEQDYALENVVVTEPQPRARAVRSQIEVKAQPSSEIERAKRVSTGLASQIEKEQIPQTSAARAQTMSKIAFAAERLLRAGKDIENVAALTRIPLRDLQEMQARISGDSSEPVIKRHTEAAVERSTQQEQVQPEPSTPQRDPRLGVLGGMKRQVQVL